MALLLLLLSGALLLAGAQGQPAPVGSLGCNGVQLSYVVGSRTRIRPFTASAADQPYAFQAMATVLNSGTTDILAWSLLVNFTHRDILVSASPAVLTSGDAFPYTAPRNASTSFSGFPSTDLKTPISTAGDLSQIQAQFTLVGTNFGPAPALPSSLTLADPSFLCPSPLSNSTANSITTCCVSNPAFQPNVTDNATEFLPRRIGDLTIAYDVTQSMQSSYIALVTIENHNDLARLDQWRLSWDWMREEFIYSMRGAYPTVISAGDCIFGAQGQYYQDFDFSKSLNCERSPVIMDLPLSRFNDSQVGMIPGCCRNGTILPPEMDLAQSTSAFQMQVFKMPPDLNRTKLYPPQNWRITGGEMNPDFRCGPPVRVTPAEFPDPSGLQSTTSAVASWQVTCNLTTPSPASPSTPAKCCVSFSAFYNDSVVPCRTCACGCSVSKSSTSSCNATAPALLLPPMALLLPFDNRSSLADQWASQKHLPLPSLPPCGDNCGVSINWHIVSDYNDGWAARVTIFNWEGVSFADWFAAAELGAAYDGFQDMYSFNASKIGNHTIFMQGMPGLNYLVSEVAGDKPGDPRLPGKQQSVMSFTKKNLPEINVVAGDGFPKKVFFNGEECSLPLGIPNRARSVAQSKMTIASFLLLLASIMILWNQ